MKPTDKQPLLPVKGQTGEKAPDNSPEIRQSTRWSRPAALLACVAYMLVGPTLIILNSHILNDVKFKYPMALSGLGLTSSACFVCFLVHVVGAVQLTPRPEFTNTFFLTRCVPVGFLTAVTLATGNIVYLHLSVAFIQILKAFSPPLTLVIIYMCGIEKPRLSVSLSVLGIACSTALATYGELNFDMLGFTIMMISSLSESIRLVLTQTLLTNLKFTVFEGLYYLAPVSVVFLLFAISIIEAPRMYEDKEHIYEIMGNHWPLFLYSAILGVVVNFLAFLVIQATSSVTLKVLASARNAGLVMFCALFLGEAVTPLQGVCYTLALVCFGWYNYIRS